MHYIRGEKLIFWGKPHWIGLVRPAALAALGLSALVVSALSKRWGILCWPGSAAVLLAVPKLAGQTRIIVTSHRLCVKTGWWSTSASEIVLNRIGAISMAQSPLGRLLDYGTIMIRGLGPSETIHRVSKPESLRAMIHEAIASRGSKPSEDVLASLGLAG